MSFHASSMSFPALVGLHQHFLRADHVAQRADRIGAAARNQVGLVALLAQALAHGDQFIVHVQAGVAGFQRAVEYPVEQHIAIVVVLGRTVCDALFQQRGALQAEFRGCRRGLAHVVGLGCALRHQVGCALRQRIADQELQLASLVAAAGKAGAVVPLDIDGGAAQMLRQAGQRFKRRGRVGQDDARKA